MAIQMTELTIFETNPLVYLIMPTNPASAITTKAIYCHSSNSIITSNCHGLESIIKRH